MRFFRSYRRYTIDQGVIKDTSSFTYVWQALVLFAVVGMTGILMQPVSTPSNDGATQVRSSRALTKYKQLESRFGTINKVNSDGTPLAVVNSMPSTAGTHNVVTTMFWVGEIASSDNGFIANTSSAWDENWQDSFGGVDDPNNRNGFLPSGFTPKENPFYFALPYSDITDGGKRKASAKSCPNASVLSKKPYSWCKNAWIMITHGSKVTYAQWEDVGPYEDNDVSYVFGLAKPKNNRGAKAGLDVSPAVQTYLGLKDVDIVQWQFIEASAVPDGPWKQIVTTSLGDSL